MQIWEGGKSLGVCSGLRTKEGEREVMCVSCRHAVGNMKSEASWERKEGKGYS